MRGRRESRICRGCRFGRGSAGDAARGCPTQLMTRRQRVARMGSLQPFSGLSAHTRSRLNLRLPRLWRPEGHAGPLLKVRRVGGGERPSGRPGGPPHKSLLNVVALSLSFRFRQLIGDAGPVQKCLFQTVCWQYRRTDFSEHVPRFTPSAPARDPIHIPRGKIPSQLRSCARPVS